VTPISPYTALALEWRAQAARCRAEDSLVSQAAALTFGGCARQLEAAAAHDFEHAAMWRRRWEIATGYSEPVAVQSLSADEMMVREKELRGDLEAHRERAREIQSALLGLDLERERRNV